MFKDAFEKLDEKSRKTILDRVAPKLDVSAFDPEKCTILAASPSFYPAHRFLEITDFDQTPPRIRTLIISNSAPEDIYILNGTNQPVYTLNKKAPLVLTEDNMAEYIKFFFRYVRSSKGAFHVIESIDDIKWTEDPPPAAKKAISDMIFPVRCVQEGSNGYALDVCLLFKNGLFKAIANLAADGTVILTGQDILIEDMPVMDDVLA